jgi:hypothetical protein
MKTDANKLYRLALVAVFATSIPALAGESVNGYTPGIVSAVTNVAPSKRSGPDSSSNNNSGVTVNTDQNSENEGANSPARNDQIPYGNTQQYGNPGDENSGSSDGEDGSSNAGDRGFSGAGDHGFSDAGDHGFSNAGDHSLSNTEDGGSSNTEDNDSSSPGSSDND